MKGYRSGLEKNEIHKPPQIEKLAGEGEQKMEGEKHGSEQRKAKAKLESEVF
jgi:hypothetical protein